MKFFFALSFVFLSCNQLLLAINKISNGKGSWSTAAIWTPSGVPTANDQVTIRNGDSIQVNNNFSIGSLTINSGGTVSMAPAKVLTISGNLTVNGKMTMNGADIIFATAGSSFTIGAGGFFTWEPNTNTLSMATLFTNGIENFAPSSTLIIKKWYNYAIPLGSVISGNFGNLRLNSLNGSFLTEWDQNNEFETHLVTGTLIIDQGWIVLDKSGKISNTTIGNITLLNANSFFDIHGGTHPGSFIVNTTNISISAGMFNGIYDGNGNITLNVTGNISLSNTGSLYLNYNDGVSSVGNGNVSLQVGGTFSQSSGDFRGIYNLTSYSCGISALAFANVNLTGGIFMGHYGCHNGGGTNTLSISGDLNINYSSQSDKFRAVGLSQLASMVNNVKLNFSVGGNVSVTGHSNAEFFSQVASGAENVIINGNATFNGCTNSFDYGVAAAAHAFSLTINGDLNVSNGTVHLARIGGNGTSSVGGNVNITGGNLIVKADAGSNLFTVQGNFTQNGGNFLLHSNTATPTLDEVNVNINGSFTHGGGIINFDDNTSASAATHHLNLNGSACNLTGPGTITHASAGTGKVFGMINFSRQGTITFNRSSSFHNIQQVKQTIISGCILNIQTGNIQIASYSIAGNDFFKISSGGALVLNNNQILSNGNSSYSGMRIDGGGLMKTCKPQGLYDGTVNAAINASHAMNYFLDENSTIEYNGTDNQVITGIGAGLATTNNHKYGRLKINFTGTKDIKYTYLSASNVYVRSNLNLESGELNLNNFTLTIESGNTNAITRNSGYLKSETNSSSNGSIVKWMNMTNGQHIFPFGYSSGEYIPITFSPISGMGGQVSIATRKTNTPDNMPFPDINNSGPAPNQSSIGIDFSTNSIIDRWYDLNAPGFTADVILSYRGAENTTSTVNSNGYFGIRAWDGLGWSARMGNSKGVTTGIGTITVSGVSQFGQWAITQVNAAIPVLTTNLITKTIGGIVEISWFTDTSKTYDSFIIERSSDGINFNEIEKVAGTGASNEVLWFSTKDIHPLNGTSYYRLKQIYAEGKTEYSKMATVDIAKLIDIENNSVDKIAIFPNPFKDQFEVNYVLESADVVTIQVINSNGQMVFNKQIESTPGQNKFSFTDGNQLKPGSYVINLISKGTRTSRKIIKNM